MGGILKNPLKQDQIPLDATNEDITAFRKQVYKNTQLNAKLNTPNDNTEVNNDDDINMEIHTLGNGKIIPKDVLTLKREADERMKWNERNLAENEIAKQQYQDIHVDEPKTPYQGAVDPQGEYYRVDDDDENNNDRNNLKLDDINSIDDFSLGEPEYKTEDLNVNNENENTLEQGEEEEEELDEAVAKHKRFEEMRKKHYDVRAVFNKKKLAVDDNDEEE